MAILVTGGAGYIGGHMVLALLDAGEQVVVLDDLSTGFAWAVPSAATLVVGDISDEAKLRAIAAAHRIDAIAHFAAKIVVPEFSLRPTRLLSQQHGQGPSSPGIRCKERHRKIYFFLYRRRLRRARC